MIEQHSRTRQGLHGVHGTLCLDFGYDATSQRTRLLASDQRPPLKIIRAFPLSTGGALVHLHNISGGILGGDQLTLSARIGPRASVQLTSTSATRVYRSRPDQPPARQTCQLQVQQDALLEYLPDPLIPFADSRYQQHTAIELAPGAGLFWWETIAPGRSAYGERFAYTHLDISVRIAALDRPIAIERFTLEPRQRPLTSPVRLGPYDYSTSFYICRVGLEASRWNELERSLTALAQQHSQPGETSWGVSTLTAHGLLVRGLSRQGRHIAATLFAFWHAAKLALYGDPAIPPRKVY